MVIDESHNLNKRSPTRQELNLVSLAGVPKLLLSGTPGTSPAELYGMLRVVRHPSVLASKHKLSQAAASRKAAAKATKAAKAAKEGVEVVADAEVEDDGPLFRSEKEWRAGYFVPKTDLVQPSRIGKLVELLQAR